MLVAARGINKATLWNFVQFQLSWVALVLAVANNQIWLGIALFLALIVIHLLFFSRDSREWQFFLVVAAIGLTWESFIHGMGLLSYPHHSASTVLAPLWMMALWINFASTINHSLRWLKGEPILAALFGAIGGPLAFLAGQKLGAVNFEDPVVATLALVIGWGMLTPLLLWLADKFTSGTVPVGGDELQVHGGCRSE